MRRLDVIAVRDTAALAYWSTGRLGNRLSIPSDEGCLGGRWSRLQCDLRAKMINRVRHLGDDLIPGQIAQVYWQRS